MKFLNSAAPFLKWAGGKRQLIPEIEKRMPKKYRTYHEPFVGGGAVLFAVEPERAVINDVNPELYNCYVAVRDCPDELILKLKEHQERNSKDYFYKIRNLDRSKEYVKLFPAERAARVIYLNRTCYNGLYRVNSSGHFNVPFGRYINPKILNEPLLRAVSMYLNKNKIEILNVDFAEALKKARKGDFVYLDPPYDPLSESSSFTKYSHYGFSSEDQERLRDEFERLDKKGCLVMLSNSATKFIRNLYKGYKIHIVHAIRAINSVGTGRGNIREVIVTNYER